MCGISGYLHLDLQSPAEARIVEEMNRQLAHRGPDDEGVWVEGPIALAQRRLSIIDLESGRQPLANEDGTIWVTFNGEIYNFQELAAELVAKGHQFATRTDTEVLVHLYEEHGPDFVQRLNGMFALGLWDARRQRLVLARDHMGQKPLYWGVFDGQLLFASELKGILAHPAARRDIDMDALAHYLALASVPSPYSIFRGIRKLQPGGRLIVERGDVQVDQYWEYPLGATRSNLSLQEAEDQLIEKMQQSVKSCLVSDVPLGVFLSGGLDSSTVAALTKRVSPGVVKTFSIGFDDAQFDESSHARRVAKYLGTEHHEQILRPADALELIPRIGKFIDEPLADPSIIPTYLLSRFARQHVTVALGGDGSDELMAGYPSYVAQRYLAKTGKLTSLMARRFLNPWLKNLPSWLQNSKSARRLQKFSELLSHQGTLARYYASKRGLFPHEHQQLFTDDAWEAVSPEAAWQQGRRYLEACPSQDPLEQIFFLDAKLYMQDDVLVKVDRASMAVALEVRAPFLDVNVVAFLASLPTSYKVRGWTGKYLLKRAARRLLPGDIIHRPKMGFAIPVAQWLRGEFRTLLEDLFTTERLNRRGLFRPQYVRRLMSEHFSGARDHQHVLWQLLMFELWAEEHLHAPVAASVS